MQEGKNIQKSIYCLCNKEHLKLIPKGLTIISSLQKFQELRKKNLFKEEAAYGLILFTELIWEENRYYTDFWAMDFIYRMRVEWSIKLPILLTATYPEITMEGLMYAKENQKTFHYLGDPATRFIPLNSLTDATKQEIQEAFPSPIISSRLLEDLKENLYKKTGYLSNFFSDLQAVSYTHLTLPTKA